MKILITGIGITGKSTFRRLLVDILKKAGSMVKHFDADQFDEVRTQADEDCLKNLPTKFDKDTVYLIEDVHGPLKSAVLPLSEYNFIFYLLPNILSQILFWLPRMWRWFQNGHFSWEAKTGWQGTGVPNDPRNIFPILKNFIRDLRNRKKWIKEDLTAINPFSHQIVKSYWSSKGPRFDEITIRTINELPLS